MKNPICISTGCVYKLFDYSNRDSMIEELRKFSPMGIELCSAYPEYLLSFDINENNLKYLRSLKFNSIHAPWKNITYGSNSTSDKVLQKISELYKLVNARNVVFHKGQIKDYESILNGNFEPSIENDDWRKPKYTIEDIENILNKNGKLKFTFDFAHALTVSPADIPAYLGKFKDKLIEIHLAMLNKNLKSHWFLHKYDNPGIRDLLDDLKKASNGVPLVLECVLSNRRELPLIKKEMEYIKSI